MIKNTPKKKSWGSGTPWEWLGLRERFIARRSLDRALRQSDGQLHDVNHLESQFA